MADEYTPTDGIDRAELRQDVAFAQRLTGTYQADSARGYYPAMDRIFTAVPALLDALEQAEAERDVLYSRWSALTPESTERLMRAEQAEARIVDALALCDEWAAMGTRSMNIGAVRRALTA